MGVRELGEMWEEAFGPKPDSGAEYWRAIPGRHPYEVSNRARVRNADTGYVLSPDNHKGYMRVKLAGHGKHFVHALVLEAFVGPRPPGHHGRHVHDPDPTNCNVWNLAWGTPAENSQDRLKHSPMMLGTATDLTGRVFGRLRVISRAPRPPHTRQRKSRWFCLCSCGAMHAVRGDVLLSGRSRQCPGCTGRAVPVDAEDEP